MNDPQTDSGPSFARTFLLPALWIFALPAFSYWFSSHQIEVWTAGARRSILRAAQQKGRPLNALQQLRLKRFDLGEAAFRTCGSTGFFHRPGGRSSKLCSTVLQFAWVRWLSLALIALALFAGLVVGLGLLWAKAAPQSQHRGFRLGWVTLRLFGVIHILIQGLLTVFLSFWVTAIWLQVYVVYLILLAVIVAGTAAFVSIKALFVTQPQELRVHGSKLSDAPAFIEHIEALAERVGTAPPAHIVVGIDDNFFVTETPLLIHERYPSEGQPFPEMQELTGRTLFVSLPLMRLLEKAELDGVLAHELGHFLAHDTAQLRKLNVQYWNFDSYMQQLMESFTWGVASCMIAFRAAFEVITQKHSRLAEFRADATAAEATSAEGLAGALLKIAAYSHYRMHTESELLEAMDADKELRIADRVAQGFATFLSGEELREKLLQEETPHPFDSHPPMRERLSQLGVDVDAQLFESLKQRPDASWCEAIPEADAQEGRLWEAYEEQFQSQRAFLIALRLRPTNDEEAAHVESFFPEVEHYDKKGERLAVSWWGLTLQSGDTVEFDEVEQLEKKDGTFAGETLIIHRHGEEKLTAKLGPGNELFLAALEERWQRHQIASAVEEEGESVEPGQLPGQHQ